MEVNVANRIIEVNGYRAFRGWMKIHPDCHEAGTVEIYGDWLYNPDTNCWYCKDTLNRCYVYPYYKCTIEVIE